MAELPPTVARKHAWNRTPRDVEQQIVRLHVDAPQLGAGQLQRLAYRVLGFRSARETIRRILIRNQDLIGEMEEEKRRVPRRIEVSKPNRLWGMDLTLVWILGFLPVWLLGVVDSHGSRLVALEALRWPSAASVAGVVARAMATHGAPERVLSDRGSVFRAERFEALLCARGVAHTLARPCHPWMNGRIEACVSDAQGDGPGVLLADPEPSPARADLPRLRRLLQRAPSPWVLRGPDTGRGALRPTAPARASRADVLLRGAPPLVAVHVATGAGEEVGPAPRSLTTSPCRACP